MLKEEVRKSLVERRLSLGLSRKTLSSQIGISYEALAKIEKGERNPRKTTLRVIADCLKLDRETLQPINDGDVTDINPIVKRPAIGNNDNR